MPVPSGLELQSMALCVLSSIFWLDNEGIVLEQKMPIALRIVKILS